MLTLFTNRFTNSIIGGTSLTRTETLGLLGLRKPTLKICRPPSTKGFTNFTNHLFGTLPNAGTNLVL